MQLSAIWLVTVEVGVALVIVHFPVTCSESDTAILQADSFIVDLYMGSGNPVAGFRWTIGGFWNTLVKNMATGTGIESVSFNFGPLDDLARGLHKAGVCPILSLIRALAC